MASIPDIPAFLKRVTSLAPGPGVSLDPVLEPSLEEEAALRRLFAKDKTDPALRDPYVGLVDVFKAPEAVRLTRARHVQDEEELTKHYVLPLSSESRRKDGELAMAANLEEFKENFRIFTEGSLGQFDWSNVVVAGGSVLGCLSPVPKAARVSKRALRRWFHTSTYPTSDVDLFLWGLTPEAAEQKIKVIYEAVRDSVPWDVTCVRTKHAVSIHSQYPYRTVQIVLRLYSSPAEILAGFDVDAACCAYDGSRVWANPRALVALMRQCNTVDMTRRSPSYEVRLAKYSSRSFEVYVPNLRREDIDPTIYERSIVRIEGLARLLVLEKLSKPESRVAYLDNRRKSRGRPNVQRPWQRHGRKYKGDLKSDVALNGLQMNSYDVASLHIPYGPGWDAKRIEKLIYQTDLGMNSPFNPKNKGRKLHRHPAFFGDLDCLEDCCQACPEPIGEEEAQLQEKEDEIYLRGRITFMQENPGRQSISGSFNPIDEGEWSDQAYITENMKLFHAISTGDMDTVTRMIENGVDVNRRDHVGRSPLHLAIMCKMTDIAAALIDANARMTARIVDGRTSLHLAAQAGLPIVIRKLMERSAINAAKDEEKKKEKERDDISESDTVRMSSEDDWSSDSDDEERGKSAIASSTNPKTVESPEGLPEDASEEPDVLDINLPDWDLAFTPLDHAVVSGSADAVAELCTLGADPSLHTKANGYGTQSLNPLTLTALCARKDEVPAIISHLVKAGAKSTTAEENFLSSFHRIVRNKGSAHIISALLRFDPTAKVALSHPFFVNDGAVYPVSSALTNSDWATFAVLVANGAKLVHTEEDVFQAITAYKASTNGPSHRISVPDAYPGNVYMPFETSLACSDDIVHLLLKLGADVNLPIHIAFRYSWQTQSFLSLGDFVHIANERLAPSGTDISKTSDEEASTSTNDLVTPRMDSWRNYFEDVNTIISNIRNQSAYRHNIYGRQTTEDALRPYMQDVEALLTSAGAKTWTELFPHKPADATAGKNYLRNNSYNRAQEKPTRGYTRRSHGHSSENVPSYLVAAYDELFEACWKGDNGTIRRLCLSSPDGQPDQKPLVIAAYAVPDSRYSYYSLSTAWAAAKQGHWDTVRLILAICSAQYRPPPEEKPVTPKFESVSKIMRDDSSDSDGSDDSEDDELDSELKPMPTYLDLEMLKSDVQSSEKPFNLLFAYHQWPNKDHTSVEYGSLLDKAILEHDADTFSKLVEIGDSLKAEPEDSTELAIPLDKAFIADDPHVLDVIIRRTGSGLILPISGAEPSDSAKEKVEVAADEKSEKRVYDGLIVRGVKRKDLARRGDPDAKPETKPARKTPLLWKAAGNLAPKIITYLSSARVTEAYRAWAESHPGEEEAQHIKRSSDLASDLQEWLGWSNNEFGESVLVATVIGNLYQSQARTTSTSTSDMQDDRSHEAVIKQLFNAHPRLKDQTINTPLWRAGLTPLLLAVKRSCSTGLVQCLLDFGADPLAADYKGWNIYHYAVDSNNEAMIRFLATTLPTDITTELLLSKTNKRFNTPIHLAAKRGYPTVLGALLGRHVPPLAYELFDADGATPLHVAVLGGKSEITRILLEAMVTSGVNLNLENALGDVAYEVASQRYLLHKTQNQNEFGAGVRSGAAVVPDYEVLNLPNPIRNDASKLEENLTALRDTLARLRQDGQLSDSTMTNAFDDFVSLMETHLQAARSEAVKASESRSEQQTSPSVDAADVAKTFDVVRAFVDGSSSSCRQLVHLHEVQSVVKTRLAEQKRQEAVAAKEAKFYARLRTRGNPDLEFDEKEDEEDIWDGVYFGTDSSSYYRHRRYGEYPGADTISKVFGEDVD